MLNIGGAVNVFSACQFLINLDGRVDTSYVLRQESHISSRSTSRMYDDNRNPQHPPFSAIIDTRARRAL